MNFSDPRKLVKILKALANPRRLGIITNLAKYKTLNVSGVAEKLDLSIRSTSKHLLKLEEVGIVERTHRSRDVFYRLANNKAIDVIGSFARMSE